MTFRTKLPALVSLLALAACDVPLLERESEPEASAMPMARAEVEAEGAQTRDQAEPAAAPQADSSAAAEAEPIPARAQAPGAAAPVVAAVEAESRPAPPAGDPDAPPPVMSTPPTFEPIVPRDATVQTVGALPCPEGTRQTGGAHSEHSVLGTDLDMTYCIEWPMTRGSMPIRRGPAVWFHDDGTIEQQGHYLDRKRTGWWEKRHESGELEARVHYTEGEYDGGYFTWYEDGTPQSEIEWRMGKHHGVSKTWGSDGEILATKRWEDDRVVATWMYDAKGNAHRM